MILEEKYKVDHSYVMVLDEKYKKIRRIMAPLWTNTNKMQMSQSGSRNLNQPIAIKALL